MVKCPRCFEQLTENYVFACLNPDCETSKDDPLVAKRLGDSYDGRIGTFRVGNVHDGNAIPGVCPACHEPEQELCAYCHFVLPIGYRYGESVCIALAGARSTGKSLYIAVAVKYLKLFLQDKWRAALLPAKPSNTKKVYEEFYEGPLFYQRGMPDATIAGNLKEAPQREPLIYEVKGLPGGRTWFIVLRDVAGEDLEDERKFQSLATVPPYLRYLRNADTILYLYDPLTIPEVADKLKGGTAPLETAIGDQLKAIHNLATLVAQVGPAPSTAPPQVGVVISKFDTLQELGTADDPDWRDIFGNFGSTFVRDATMDEPGHNENDAILHHEELKTLLPVIGGNDFMVQADAIGVRNFRMFAVSALGHSPKGQFVNVVGISPFRVLGPIKWALANRGMIPGRPPHGPQSGLIPTAP